MHHFHLSSALLISIVLFSTCAVNGHAETIVSTSFAADEQMTNMIGMSGQDLPYAPDGVAPAGAVFQLAGGGACDTWMREGAALMHNGGAVAISLDGKNANAILTIAAEITFDQFKEGETADGKEPMSEADIATARASIKGGVAVLGFYSALPAKEFGSMFTAFSGVKVTCDGGLQLFVNGEPVGAPVAYGGTFDPAAPAKLSFAVNTQTGALTKVSFGKSTASYEFPTSGFTKDATAFAGFGGSLGNILYYVNFRNFEVVSDAVSAAPPTN